MDRGLTQFEAAEQLGVAEVTVVNWERNHTSPDLRTVPRVITWLGYDPRKLGNTIGEQIRWLRRSRGISQRELAEMVGTDPTSVSRWEEGKRAPSRKHMARLRKLSHEIGSAQA